MRQLALFLSTCLLGSSILLMPGVASSSGALTGPLSTSGNQIHDASGALVHLRGLTRSTIGTNPVTQDEVDHARQWGANIVRIKLDENQWNHSCPNLSSDPNYKSEIANIVNWVTAQGMVALLELTINPRFLCDPQAENANKKMADYPGSINFWGNVTMWFMNNPLVAFELYNEPHDITDAVWRNGGLVMDGPVMWQAAGMQQMYNTIRGMGAQNLIFVSGTNWSSTPPALQLNGYNVVYGAHVYTCPHDPPPNCMSVEHVGPGGLLTVSTPMTNPYDPSTLLDRWTVFAATYPLVITEFGWPDSNNGTYNANLVSQAEQRGWGWIAYCWMGSTGGDFNLLADTTNYTPTPSGVPIKQGLSINP